MTAPPMPPGGADAAPEIEVVSVSWIRVQVHLRVRASGEIDPRTLRLRQVGAHDTVPVTGWETQDGDLVLRFNVMQGPGGAPLGTGSWQLVVEPSPGQPVVLRVAVIPGLDLDAAAATFRIELGDGHVDYRVVPGVDLASGSLVLDVDDGFGDQPNADGQPPSRTFGRRSSKVRGGLLLFLFRLFRLVLRRNRRRILFSSDSRAELGGNLRVVHDRMVERGLDTKYELLTLFKPHLAEARSMVDRIRLPWLLARADVIVIDDYQPVMYRVDDPEVRIVQLWHAVGAFKTVGYSRVGKPGAPNPWGRAHKNYTYAIVSSQHDVAAYAEAFGIPEAAVIPTGIPRVDRFLEARHREQAIDAAYRAFPAARGRMTILFAPTFRGPGARTATYDLDRLDYAALHALCVEKDAVCLIRLHPFVREPLGIPDALVDRLIDASDPAIDVNDLLYAVDLLITDYSSVVFEYSTLGRPMLFFAYDLEAYVAERDFYQPYEAFVPGRIVRTCEELLDAIRREDYQIEKVAPFAARHFDHLEGGATDRVIALILAP